MSRWISSYVVPSIAEPAGFTDGSGAPRPAADTSAPAQTQSSSESPATETSAPADSPTVLTIPSVKPIPTDFEALLASLSTLQRRALECLVSGQHVKDAARAVGVTRSTLHRWIKHNTAFASLLNEWDEQLQQAAYARLMSTTDKAVENVAEAVEQGNVRVSLQLLKGLGVLRARPLGPTDPEELRLQLEVESRARRVEALNKITQLELAETIAKLS